MTTLAVANRARVFSADDLSALKLAYQRLEHPSFAMRLSNVVGTPIEIAFRLLPKNWYKALHAVVDGSLRMALISAIDSLPADAPPKAQNGLHKTLSMVFGGVGGFLGLLGLLVEIPLTTTLMMRSIAQIARTQGEDLASTEARLACLEVFALGARSQEDDAAETGYYSVRLALTMSIRSAELHVLEHGLASREAPVLVRLICAVSSRFGVALSEKTAAQLVPVVGAIGGASVNALFMQHYQDVAWSHFTVRRLERLYGADRVRREYERLEGEDTGLNPVFSAVGL
jgi:hypothetical protein